MPTTGSHHATSGLIWIFLMWTSTDLCSTIYMPTNNSVTGSLFSHPLSSIYRPRIFLFIFKNCHGSSLHGLSPEWGYSLDAMHGLSHTASLFRSTGSRHKGCSSCGSGISDVAQGYCWRALGSSGSGSNQHPLHYKPEFLTTGCIKVWQLWWWSFQSVRRGLCASMVWFAFLSGVRLFCHDL